MAGLHIDIKELVGQLADIYKSLLGEGSLAIGYVQAGRQTGNDERSRSYGHAVAPQELARSIPGVASTRLHRPPLEEGTDIAGEGFHRSVTLFGLLPKSFPQDVADVGRKA